MCELRINQVHLEQGYLRVSGKGDKERMVPMHERCMRVLRTYLTQIRPTWEKQKSTRVFLNSRGNVLTRQYLSLIHIFSIRQILPVLAEQFADMEIVALVKPQFEAGRAKVGKHGIVKNEKVHIEVLQSMCDYVKTLGLYVHHLCASSVLGRDGNKEFVMHLKHTQTHKVFPIRDIVKNYTVKR